MANQFFFEEQQITDIITSLLFTSGGCMIDDDKGEGLNKRCADLAIKLKKQYGRPIKIEEVLIFDEPEENPYSEKIFKGFPELKGNQ